MVYLLNTSDTIGAGIWGLNSITGNWHISLLIVFVLLIALAFVFRIPLEFTTIFLLPIGIAFAVASNNFLPVIVVILMFAGVLLARNFIFPNQ